MSASNAIMSFTAPFRCLVSKFVFIASNTHCMVTFRCAGQRSTTLSGCRTNLVLKKSIGSQWQRAHILTNTRGSFVNVGDSNFKSMHAAAGAKLH